MSGHTPSTRPRPKPIAILTIAEVTRAVEDYLLARNPKLADRVRSHGIRMHESGHLVWELHNEQINGIDVVEVTYEKTG